MLNLQPEQVIGWIELEGLPSARDLIEPADILSGLPYDPKNVLLFVTGSVRTKLFDGEFVPG